MCDVRACVHVFMYVCMGLLKSEGDSNTKIIIIIFAWWSSSTYTIYVWISISCHNTAIYHFDCGGFTIFSFSLSLSLRCFFFFSFSFPNHFVIVQCSVCVFVLSTFCEKAFIYWFLYCFQFQVVFWMKIHTTQHRQRLSDPVNEINLRVVFARVEKKNRNWFFQWFFHSICTIIYMRE